MLKDVWLAVVVVLNILKVSGLTVETEGLYHTVKGLAFYKSYAFSTEAFSSGCGVENKCRTACSQSSECLMFTGYHVQDTHYCNLYSSTPYTMKQPALHFSDSFLSVKDVAPGSEYDSRDGYMYWLGTTLETITQAHHICNNMAGYRLGIYKEDVQVDILQHYYTLSGGTDSILMSLTKDPTTGSPVWGDGSSYNDSGAYASLIVDDGGQSSTVYAYGLNSKINDLPTAYHGYVLCQGTPYLTPIL